MIPVYDKQDVTIYHGDSVEVMRSLPENSVDSIVTDPPYGLSFMGKKEDYDVPSVQLWAEALRVLKPGGHLLSFAGSRTYHRMAVNIEDAGFEIRDQIMWLYGSGFPKSLDISKAIDKAAGAEREKVSIPASQVRNMKTSGGGKDGTKGATRPFIEKAMESGSHEIDGNIPATPEAALWEGWGTALKPAHEPIVVARKPFDGTVAENVLKHGTGGINIDGGRIGTEGGTKKIDPAKNPSVSAYGNGLNGGGCEEIDKGRFPANIILDPEAGAMLDEQSGELISGDRNPSPRRFDKNDGWGMSTNGRQGDSGGASRFFYCAKASKQDRDEGLEGMAESRHSAMGYERGLGDNGEGMFKDRNPLKRNSHPTVKPTILMQYLVRLVTPKGGISYDPFMGSGSTGKAAVREGFKFIGSEREAEYIPISIARINAPAQVELL